MYFKALGIGYSPLFDRLIGEGYTAGEALLPPNAPLTTDNMFNAIMAARYLNVVYSSLLAVLLFVLGTALLDRRLGILAAAVFVLDPYVMWRNHFNYLEPLAGVFGVLTILFYYRAVQDRDEEWQLAVGRLQTLNLQTLSIIRHSSFVIRHRLGCPCRHRLRTVAAHQGAIADLLPAAAGPLAPLPAGQAPGHPDPAGDRPGNLRDLPYLGDPQRGVRQLVRRAGMAVQARQRGHPGLRGSSARAVEGPLSPTT